MASHGPPTMPGGNLGARGGRGVRKNGSTVERQQRKIGRKTATVEKNSHSRKKSGRQSVNRTMNNGKTPLRMKNSTEKKRPLDRRRTAPRTKNAATLTEEATLTSYAVRSRRLPERHRLRAALWFCPFARALPQGIRS